LRLINKDKKFELKVVSYQYANSKDYFDSNWLNIEVSVEDCNGNKWKAISSCLRTTELVQLKAWLESIYSQNILKKEIVFTENELSFIIRDQNNLMIRFSGKFHPDYPCNESEIDTIYDVSFILNDRALINNLKEIEKYLAKFPVRGNK
jgi:hypothetical protein